MLNKGGKFDVRIILPPRKYCHVCVGVFFLNCSVYVAAEIILICEVQFTEFTEKT